MGYNMFSDRKTNVLVLISTTITLLVLMEAYRQASGMIVSGGGKLIIFLGVFVALAGLSSSVWYNKEIKRAWPKILFSLKLICITFAYVSLVVLPMMPWNAVLFDFPLSGVFIDISKWLLPPIVFGIAYASWNIASLFKWRLMQIVMFPIINAGLNLASIWTLIYAAGQR